MTQNDRLEIIETKLAHLERALQELGQTVMRQQRDLEILSARERLMQSRLDMLESGATDSDQFEKPPHY
jgi:uncharacterized coiled-coil protein SlyX